MIQMKNITEEMAWLKETLNSKPNQTIDKQDSTFQVNIRLQFMNE